MPEGIGALGTTIARLQGPGLARSLADVVLQLQLDVAATLAGVIADGRLNRARYQDWLGLESAACRIGALALDAVGNWHGANPALQDTAYAWASEQRMCAQLAAADIRAMDGVAMAPPPSMAQWQAYVTEIGHSQRAGEALGTAALQAAMLRGPVRDVLAALATLPVTERAGGYLARRLQVDVGATHLGRIALQNEYATVALVTGAQRGAGWLGNAFLAVFNTPAH